MSEHHGSTLLGQVLVSGGLITPEELEQALSQQHWSGEPLGQILVAMGALAPNQLDRALQEQARLRGEAAAGRPLVLVVEDDLEAGAVEAEILEEAGYQVRIAHNEAEAMAAMMEPEPARPKVIVLDLGLPQRGGVEFLTVLRKNGGTQGVPVVILSGHLEMEDELQERGLEVSDFLTKPARARHLVEAVARALRQSSACAASPVPQASGAAARAR